MAAWDETARLRLFDAANQVEGGSTRVLPAEEGDGTVSARRLDSLLQLHASDRIDLVKLDVEGADIHALGGMSGLLERFKPTLFIECHDIYGYYERADLEACLTRLGYTWETAFSYATAWQPTGIANEPKLADYLVAKPKET